MTGGRFGLRPDRPAKMLPILSTRTVQPASLHHRIKRRRASPSRSLAASRHTPPFGVAPICANSIRLAQRRSPLTCRFRIPLSWFAIAEIWRIRHTADGPCPSRNVVSVGSRSRLYSSGRVLSEKGVMTSGKAETERLNIRGIELELVRRGAGHPILLLHGFQTIDPEARFLDLLGRHREVIAPSSPGFGKSPRP